MQDPITSVVSLVIGDPGPDTSFLLERALFEDCKSIHHRKLISDWELFRESVTGHIRRREQWILEMAKSILDSSDGLVPFAPNENRNYVMHLKLATFIHGRLLGIERLNLTFGPVNVQIHNLLLGSVNTPKGTLSQIEEVARTVENLRRREEPRALQFRSEIGTLRLSLSHLCDEFSLAIAAKKLNRHCPLVDISESASRASDGTM